MYLADFLSRCGYKTNEEKDISMNDVVHCVGASTVNLSEDRLKEFQEATLTDTDLSKVVKYCLEGWPKESKHPGEIHHFFKLKQDIEYSNNLIYYNSRLVVPRMKRKFILSHLHETHSGLQKITDIVNNFFYWPGIMSDIKNLVMACSLCAKYQKSNSKEPLLSHEIPNIPFYKVGADIAEWAGNSYLVLVDYFSRWIEVVKLFSKNSSSVILKCKAIFSRLGIPHEMIADNMPFNSYEFKEFANQYHMKISTSSPHYPQSNGLAEKSVGIVKKMLKKAKDSNTDFELYLLNYRNSPVAGLKFSPSQLLMSRVLRSKLPIDPSRLCPALVPSTVYKSMQENQIHQKTYYDRNCVKERCYYPKERVRVQDPHSKLWNFGVIVTKLQEPRSYLIKLDNGNSVRRNSIHIRKDSRFLGESLEDLGCNNNTSYIVPPTSPSGVTRSGKRFRPLSPYRRT